MLESWKRWASVERNLAEGTVAAYSRELRSLAASVGDLDAATPHDLREWLHAHGGSPSSVSRRVSALRSYYGWNVRRGTRTDDPSAQLDRPRTHRGLPRPVDDVDRRLAMLDPETRAIAVFLVETGLRISEACAVFVRPPAPEELVVLGKGSKERRVPLTAEARAALDFLGGAIPVSARTVQRRFRIAGFNPHRLRHTLATSLIESGADIVDVQKILGHASPATTTIYAAYSTGRLRSALERRRRE